MDISFRIQLSYNILSYNRLRCLDIRILDVVSCRHSILRNQTAEHLCQTDGKFGITYF